MPRLRLLFVLPLAMLANSCIRIKVVRGSAPANTSPAITAIDLERRLMAFAHDSTMGREAGTLWNAKATDYVAAEFQKYGLKPAGENGTYFQTVPNIRVRDT